MNFIRKILAAIRKVLTWLHLAEKTVRELDDFARLELARIKASGLLESFTKIRDSLTEINAELTEVVLKTEEELDRLEREFERKKEELRKLKEDAMQEISMNNAVSIRLSEFTK